MKFGPSMTTIYGTYGDFYLNNNSIKAKYLMTKIKPGSEGSWENMLAAQLKPWREVFSVEKLSFDELIQRDLDDSRVAHELIPYLLNNTNSAAKFFPPILVVMAPRSSTSAGIENYYPPLFESNLSTSFQDLAKIEPVSWKINGEDVISPLGEISFNPQKTAFIIVDGQHRAMAILALHRQVNNDWSNNPYQHYYDHIRVSSDQIKNIELPVCLVYFPEINDSNIEAKNSGVNLNSLCREIFLAVNKNAKQVSASREVILDDSDFSAILLRKTLSKLKDRDTSGVAKIYSFSYGDGVGNLNKEVVHNSLEYSSAICVHKMCAAIVFGNSETTKLSPNPADCTDGRNTRDPNRAACYLEDQEWMVGIPTIQKNKAKVFTNEIRKKIVSQLEDLIEPIILGLYDNFNPFIIHNEEIESLKHKLTDPTIRASIEVSKAYNLIFEGSGARSTFEDHFERIKSMKEESSNNEIDRIHSFNQSVNRAFLEIKNNFEKDRAKKILSIDNSARLNDEEQKKFVSWSNSIYQTISTQAFQIGYVMSVQSLIDKIFPRGSFKEREQINKDISILIIQGLNNAFELQSKKQNIKTIQENLLLGFFTVENLGIRSLLRMSVNELNEKQWVFFRYAILEVVFSNLEKKTLDLISIETKSLLKNKLKDIVEFIYESRNNYTQKAIEYALNENAFKQNIEIEKSRMNGEGKSLEDIEKVIKSKKDLLVKEIEEKAKENLKATLKKAYREKDKLQEYLDNIFN